jgi:hypothetical protein
MPTTIKTILIAIVILLCVGCATLNPGKSHCVNIGQEWQYDTRAGEEDSRAIIVDTFLNKELQVFYIVRLTNIKIDSPHFKNHFPDEVPYVIISEFNLQQSLTRPVGRSKWNPYFDRNYEYWKKEYSGKGLIGGTLKEYLNTLEEMLNVKLGA